MAVAIALSYLEEVLKAMHRPEPLPSVCRFGSYLALLADMIVFGKMLWDAILHMWSKEP